MYYYNGDIMNIEDIKKLDNLQLANYISRNEELLLNKDIRDLLMQEEKHYAFVWIVQKIDDCSYISDDDMVNRILNDKRRSEKLNAIITSCKDISKFVKNENVIKAILSSFLVNYLNYLDLKSSRVIADYMIKNHLEKNFSYFIENVKLELIKDEKIKNAIINSADFKDILHSATPKLFNELIKYDKAKNIIYDSSVGYIMSLVSNNIIFPNELALDQRFQEKILSIEDIAFYRYFIDNLEKNNSLAAFEIDKLREKKYDKSVEEYSDGLFPITKEIIDYLKESKDISSLLTDDIVNFLVKAGISKNSLPHMRNIFYRYDTLKMRDILIDRFFKDIPIDFLKNLNIMIEYNDSLIDKVIDEERIVLYKKILDFEELSFEERKKLYKECQKYGNLVDLFYDDYRKCRDNTYTNLISSAINPENMSKQLSLEKSQKYGVPIYELTGEKFYAFVHITGVEKNNPNLSPDVWKERLHDGLSLSFIGSNNLTTYGSPREAISFGFSNLDYKRFVHLRNSDSFSNYNSMHDEHTDYIQKLYTPSNLIKETKGYNEIVYQEKSRKIELNKLMPDYVICYDEVTEGDIKVAKYYNLPIVLIDTRQYKFNNRFLDTSDSDKYIDASGFYR